MSKITVLTGNKIHFWRSQKGEILVNTCKPQLILLNLVHCTPAIRVFILYILHRDMTVEVVDAVRVTLAWADDIWFLILHIHLCNGYMLVYKIF